VGKLVFNSLGIAFDSSYSDMPMGTLIALSAYSAMILLLDLQSRIPIVEIT